MRTSHLTTWLHLFSWALLLFNGHDKLMPLPSKKFSCLTFTEVVLNFQNIRLTSVTDKLLFYYVTTTVDDIQTLMEYYLKVLMFTYTERVSMISLFSLFLKLA